MLQFGIVPATGVTIVSFLSIVAFTLLVFLIPTTLLIVIGQRLGIGRKNGKNKIEKSRLLLTVTGFALYHLFMLLLWILTWPQFTSPIHTGYSWEGVSYIALVMIFWTGTGMLAIYAWNTVRNPRVRFPGIGFYLRLYIWNSAVFVIMREIIYRFL